MKLEEKGKIIPPPVLDKYPQMVSSEIQKWGNIIAATHWNLYDLQKPDGADFYVGEEELGHIHLDGWVHLVTIKELKKVLLKHNLAEKFPYGENWVMFNICSEKDAKKAISLFRLNYDRLNGVPVEELMLKVEKMIAL